MIMTDDGRDEVVPLVVLFSMSEHIIITDISCSSVGHRHAANVMFR